jgi:hypothetical protein
LVLPFRHPIAEEADHDQGSEYERRHRSKNGIHGFPSLHALDLSCVRLRDQTTGWAKGAFEEGIQT